MQGSWSQVGITSTVTRGVGRSWIAGKGRSRGLYLAIASTSTQVRKYTATAWSMSTSLPPPPLHMPCPNPKSTTFVGGNRPVRKSRSTAPGRGHRPSAVCETKRCVRHRLRATRKLFSTDPEAILARRPQCPSRRAKPLIKSSSRLIRSVSSDDHINPFNKVTQITKQSSDTEMRDQRVTTK